MSRIHEPIGRGIDDGPPCSGLHTYLCAWCGTGFETDGDTHVEVDRKKYLTLYYPFCSLDCVFSVPAEAFNVGVARLVIDRVDSINRIKRENENA